MNFISPKNFKKGRLISNKYTSFDLAILIVGVIISLILEMIFFTYFLSDSKNMAILIAILLLLPAGISLLAVMPSGVYHNVHTFINLFFINIKTTKNYIWGGLNRNANIQEENNID